MLYTGGLGEHVCSPSPGALGPVQVAPHLRRACRSARERGAPKAYLVNLNSAVYVLPSVSFKLNWRQVLAQALSVFQT